MVYYILMADISTAINVPKFPVVDMMSTKEEVEDAIRTIRNFAAELESWNPEFQTSKYIGKGDSRLIRTINGAQATVDASISIPLPPVAWDGKNTKAGRALLRQLYTAKEVAETTLIHVVREKGAIINGQRYSWLFSSSSEVKFDRATFVREDKEAEARAISWGVQRLEDIPPINWAKFGSGAALCGSSAIPAKEAGYDFL